jgi:hypothetical protein
VRRDDEGQVVGRQSVVSGRDTPILLDLVEEPFDANCGRDKREAVASIMMEMQ